MDSQSQTLNDQEPENKTFTKEEICEICEISINTLQNWLNEEKALEDDYIKGKQGRRIYFLSYLKRVFKKALREDLIPVLEVNQSLSKDNQRLTDSLPNNNQEELLKQKDETIKILIDRTQDLKEELNQKNKQIKSLTDALEKSQTITSQQQSLSLKQNEYTALLLHKSKNSGLLGWFGFGSKGRGQKEVEDQN